MKEEQDKLFDAWRKVSPEIVTDGVVNEEAYIASKIKVLYLLKEVNGGKNWDLCEFVANGGRPQTWNNITRWTKGIERVDEDIPWTELENITEEERIHVLRSICVVNVKKISGGHTADERKVHSAAKEDSIFLKKQLALYKPDIIICCGTDNAYFHDIYNYEPKWEMTKRGIWYVREDSRIVISYSHPEARVKDCLLYYGLIDAIREIFGKQRPPMEISV